jgi:hypothetical protein
MEGRLQNDTNAVNSLEGLECPVCFGYSFDLKIFICENGHSVCENCQPHLATCPTCRGPKPVIRNFGLEQLAKAAAIFPCPYAKSGCGEILKGSEYEQHTSVCGFR